MSWAMLIELFGTKAAPVLADLLAPAVGSAIAGAGIGAIASGVGRKNKGVSVGKDGKISVNGKSIQSSGTLPAGSILRPSPGSGGVISSQTRPITGGGSSGGSGGSGGTNTPIYVPGKSYPIEDLKPILKEAQKAIDKMIGSVKLF